MRLPRFRAIRPVLPRPVLPRPVLPRPALPGPVLSRWRAGYAPRANGQADPGEVVWAWVPYEDDPAQGKDRPVLVIGRDGSQVLALPLTSKDHDRDAGQEASVGRYWMDIGIGAWDRQGRPSEVRLNRLLRLEDSAIRREGSALDPQVFDRVLQAARPYL